MKTFKTIFSRRWIIPTVIVVLGMIFLARLGVWQYDRMLQKQAYNTMMHDRWHMEPFDLTQNALPADLTELEYRRIQADGKFDYANQILISNQVFNSTAGYIVVTPYVLGADRAVLVARGWVTADQATPAQLALLEEPSGAPMIGLIRHSQAPRIGESTPPATAQHEWYRIDVPAIQGQMPYKLEPAYIEQMPEEGRPLDQAPIRQEPLPLDEGNHLSYSIQWFTFALVLGFGYIMLVRQQTRRGARGDALVAEDPVQQAVTVVPPSELSACEAGHDESEPILASEPLR